MKLLITIGLGLLFSVASIRAQGGPVVDLDVAEAVFRHQFQHNRSAVGTNAAAYFLAINGKDPDESFLRRFEGHQPPVKRLSEHQMHNKAIIDPVTGRPAVLFRVSDVERVGSDRAKAKGGFFESSGSASGNTFHLERRKDKWTVEKDEMDWISKAATSPRPVG